MFVMENGKLDHGPKTIIIPEGGLIGYCADPFAVPTGTTFLFLRDADGKRVDIRFPISILAKTAGQLPELVRMQTLILERMDEDEKVVEGR
jgi:hypothetical protein